MRVATWNFFWIQCSEHKQEEVGEVLAKNNNFVVVVRSLGRRMVY